MVKRATCPYGPASSADAPNLVPYAWPLSLSDCGAVLLITSVLNIAMAIGAGFSVIPIMVVGVALLLAILMGRAVLALVPVPLPEDARAPSELLLGTALLCAAMLLVGIFGNISAGVSFVICCGVGLFGCLVCGRFRHLQSGWTNAGLAYLAMICAISFVWSWEAINAVPRLRADETFPAWKDFFAHAGYVTQFAHLHELGGKSIFVYGDSIPIYHYGSYMLPAAVQAFTGLQSLAVVTTFWGLFGFIIMGLGASVAGAVLAGRIGGLAAIAAVLLIPDATHYWLHNSFFDFYWLLQVSATGAYAIGLAMLALAFGALAIGRGGNSLWLAAATIFLVGLFRAHIFILLALAAVPFFFFNWRPERAWRRWACLAAVLLLGVIGAAVAERIPRAPHFLTSAYAPIETIKSLMRFSASYPDLFDQLASRSIPAVSIVTIGTFLVLLSALGALLPAYFAGLAVMRRTVRSADWIPCFLMVTYCSILIAFPKDDGELQHRPFVLVYAAFAIWCSVFVVRAVQAFLPRYGKTIFATACIPLIAYPFFATGAVQLSENKWSPGQFVNFSVPEGLLKSADHIRTNAAVGDVVWFDKGDPWAILTGLTERSSFTSFEPFFANHPGATHDLINAHLSVSKELLTASSLEQFVTIATSAKIDWCVLSPDYHLPESLSGRVEFTAAGYRVIRLRLPPPG